MIVANARPTAIKQKLERTLRKLGDEWRALSVRYRSDVVDHVTLHPSRSGSTLCLFSHFSADGRVAPYVISYLAALRAADCDIAFVTGAAKPAPEDRARVLTLASEWIQRRNIGYDFGSWGTGYQLCRKRIEGYDRVLFANDSVYCMVDDLTPVLQRARDASFDVWSMTSSEELQPHLQSYFWAVERSSRAWEFLGYFWQRHYRYLSDRERVIQRYELQLGAIAERFGLRVGALNPCDALLAQARCSSNARQQALAAAISVRDTNPTHDLALALLSSSASPLVKRELLLYDPRGTRLCDEISKWASERAPLRWSEVELHLSECRRHATPTWR